MYVHRTTRSRIRGNVAARMTAIVCASGAFLAGASAGGDPDPPPRHQPPQELSPVANLSDLNTANTPPIVTHAAIPLSASKIPKRGRTPLTHIATNARQAAPCRVDGDCDDCDLCTLDTCVAQTCLNDLIPIGQFVPGAECDDSLVCNGLETCSFGACVPGVPLCSDGMICNESAQVCELPCLIDADCERDGLACTTDLCDARICVGGLADGLSCRFDEDCPQGTCSAGGSGACIVGNNPCGPGARCAEDQAGGVVCPLGRCCDALGTCQRLTQADCATAGDAWLYTGDNSLSCAADPCPAYAAGVSPQGAFPVAVGSITASGVCSDTIQSLGDDYTIAGTTFVELRTVRWVGGVDNAGDVVAFEWYDASGILIEDEFVTVTTAGTAVHTFDLPVPLTIPASGFMAVRIASSFTPGARFHWLSTDSPDTGGNDPDILILDGAIVGLSPLGRCAGGDRDGLWCDTASPNCPGGGCTDVPDTLAFELVADPVSSPIGACCDPALGTCTNDLRWVCTDNGHLFQGEGTACRRCSNDMFLNCDADGDCPACSGIPGFCEFDELTACSVDADCISVGGGRCLATPCDVNAECPGGLCVVGTCSGGSNDTNPCSPDADCGGGTCSATATCDAVPPGCDIGACCDDIDGSCVEIISPTSCPAGMTFQGYGTHCQPNACIQPGPTGGDNCATAPVIGITVPALGQPPAVVTITGNNATATFDDAVTGRCVGGINDGSACDPWAGDPLIECPGGLCIALCDAPIFDPAGNTRDPGWWEAVQLNDCADVRIDFCATLPTLTPAWPMLYSDCPCGSPVTGAGVPSPVGAGDDEAGFAYGDPFCTGGNAWVTFATLPPGVYYYPVYSGPTSTMAVPPGGSYQLHITAAACRQAACCSTVCSGGVRDAEACNVDGHADCPNGICSVGFCLGGELHGFSCDAGGVDECPAGVCDGTLGCSVTTEAMCKAANGQWLAGPDFPDAICNGGTNDGQVCADDSECQGGGTCMANLEIPTCLGTPCDTGACCSGPGACFDRLPGDIPVTEPDCLAGTFVGGVRCGFHSSLCEVCGIEVGQNCQPADTAVVQMSDLDAGTRVSDNFSPISDAISVLCVTGSWLDLTRVGPRIDCACQLDDTDGCVPTVADQFTVTLYDDVNGKPGSVVGSSGVTVTPDRGLKETFANFDLWDVSMALDSPISGLTPGGCYWIEVTNDTTDLPGSCNWYWASSSGAGDGAAAAGDDVGGPGAEVGFDLAFCVDAGIVAPGCGTRTGACCACDGTCANTVTLSDCTSGTWHEDQTCAQITCHPIGVPGDDCTTEIQAVTDATMPYQNLCATTDGPASIDCGAGTQAFGRDTWFSYTAACDGVLVASLCEGTDFDAILGVYSDGTASCPCPGDNTTLAACDDNGCASAVSLFEHSPTPCNDAACGKQAPMACLPATAGACYTLRIGGVDGARGSGNLNVACIGDVIYVNDDASGANSGSSWANAFMDLQDALHAADLARSCSDLALNPQVWVAEGTYRPDRGTSDRDASFDLVAGISVFGGFSGIETTLMERDWAAHPTILSGEIGAPGDPMDNSYHVVTADAGRSGSLLDGFVIEAGYADGLGPADRGGGLFNSSGEAVVANVIFRSNEASQGAGMYQDGGSVSLVNCLFSGNIGMEGGGIFVAGGDLSVANGTLSQNTSAVAAGGGVYALDASGLTLDNTILWGNVGIGGVLSNQIFDASGLITLRFSCVEGYDGAILGGSGNISANPLFVNPLGGDGVAGTADDALQLSAGSPCIDAGDRTRVPIDVLDSDGDGDATEPWPFDLDAELRIGDDGQTADTGRGCPYVVDMGAYEFPPDCNGNGVSDPVDITLGTSLDCNFNRIPDECEIDENSVAPGGPFYCPSGSPDCDPDCNGNGIPDKCDSPDCNDNDVPDVCEIPVGCVGPEPTYYCTVGCDDDCNTNCIPDECDIADCPAGFVNPEDCDDCNQNRVPDECDISAGTSPDVDTNGVPDECTSSVPGATGSWSSGANWIGGAAPGVTSGVTLSPFSTLQVDVDVTVAALRTRGESQLNINAGGGSGDLNVAGKIHSAGDILLDTHTMTAANLSLDGSGFRGGLTVQGSSSVNLGGGELLIEVGGSYSSNDPPSGASASLNASRVALGISFGGVASSMALKDSMTVTTSSHFVLDGRVDGPLSPLLTGRGVVARGGKTPPILRISPPTYLSRSRVHRGVAVETAPLTIEGSLQILTEAKVCVGGDAAQPQSCSASPVDDLAKVVLLGDFDNQSVYASLFNWRHGGLRLEAGGAGQVFEVAGIDLGPVHEGFETSEPTAVESCFFEGTHTNFSMKVVEVAANASVTFRNRVLNTAGSHPCAEALYVDHLILESGAQLTLDDCRVYYRELTDNSGTVPTLEGCGELLRVRTSQCSPGSAPEPDRLLDSGNVLVINIKNRFVSFAVTDGSDQAVRVTFVDLPGGFSVFNGTTMWVDVPVEYSEGGGRGFNNPCTVGSPCPEGSFLSSTLSATPVYRDWSVDGRVVHVRDELIIPHALYRVDTIGVDCSLADPSHYSDPLLIGNAKWGDAVELSAGEWRAAEAKCGNTGSACLRDIDCPGSTCGTVSVFDTLGMLAKFSGAPGAPAKARMDMLGVVTGPSPIVDGKITVSDTVSVLGAFGGDPYPFSAPTVVHIPEPAYEAYEE